MTHTSQCKLQLMNPPKKVFKVILVFISLQHKWKTKKDVQLVDEPEAVAGFTSWHH